MTDAMSVAQAAALDARTAMTQIAGHERECARRYAESATALATVDQKLDSLLEQSGIQRGKSEANRALLGNIPNALWQVVIAGCGAGAVVLATQLLKGHP